MNDRQDGLKTTYKSPSSVSFGIEYQLGKTTLAFSGEYFGAIAAYNLASPARNSFLRPKWYNKSDSSKFQINSDEYLRVLESSKSVTNFAFAIKQQVGKNLDLVASFRTDFTSYNKACNDFWEYQYVDSTHVPGQRLSFSNVDLYHITLGATFKDKQSDFHIGLTLFLWF